MCLPPFIYFSHKYDERNATKRHYKTTLQGSVRILRCHNTSRMVLLTGGESSSCKLAQRRHSRGWTSYLIPFPLPASSFAQQLPSDELRERQDRPFRLTGKTLLVLFPSTPIALYQLCTMPYGRRQALNVLEKGEWNTFWRKERIWRYKYHTQFSSNKADGSYIGYYKTVSSHFTSIYSAVQQES